jgi:hypothetical protein
MSPVMRRSNFVIATASAAVGLLAIAMTLAAGELFAVGTVLGIVLLANALVRYLIAQRQ